MERKLVFDNLVIVTQSASRLRGIDALRGIAAICVVLIHYTQGYSENIASHTEGLVGFFRYGHFGVKLFFVISGFVIFLTLERAPDWRAFALARFARLYPAFLACWLLTGTLIVLAGFNPFHVTAIDAATNLTLLSQAIGTKWIDPSSWTLTYEVIFYAAAAILYCIFGIRRMELPCLIWLAIAWIGHRSEADIHYPRLAVLLNFNYSYLFVAGMTIYRMVFDTGTWLTSATLLFCTMLACYDPQNRLPNGTIHPPFVALMVVFGVAVYLTGRNRLRWLQSRPLLFLGDISYSLYLIHQVFGYWMIRQLERGGVNPNLAVAAAVAASILLGFAIRTLVEIPAQRALRKVFVAAGPYRPVVPT